MATNPTYKPSEGKREEFRRYLEKTGVMDALTKGLVSLYEEPEKPTDALTYLLNKLAVQCSGESFEDIKTQLQEAKDKIAVLEEENQQLKAAGGAEAEGAATGEGETSPKKVSAAEQPAAPAPADEVAEAPDQEQPPIENADAPPA